MKRRMLALAFPPLFLGLVGLSTFSKDVRTVQAVGLIASGACLGVAFVLLVLGLTGVIKGNKGDATRSEAGKEQERQQS